jgi:hypothetical protein
MSRALVGEEETVRRRLYSWSLATLAGIAAASAQEVPKRSFEETLKFVLFGDSKKSESIHKAADGTTTKLMLTESDEKSCSAGIIIQQDKQKHGETKATLTLDFKAVRNWRRSASSFILEGGIMSSPVLKSNKMEWLRIDTDKAKDEKPRSNELFFGRFLRLPSEGDEQRATEAMSYLMDTLCPTNIIFGPSTKF